MNEDLDDILDDCLDRLSSGELDIAGCLARYPQHADVLKGLLETALSMEAPQTSPSREAALSGERLLLQAVSAKRSQREAAGFLSRAGSLLAFPRLNVRWAAAVPAVFVVLLLGIGAVAASGGALPGGPLYPVKRAAESVRVALTTSDEARAELHLDLAERRVEEMSDLAGRRDAKLPASLAEDLGHHLQEAQVAAAAVPDEQIASGLRSKLENSASSQLGMLQEQLGAAEEEALPSISAAFTAVSEEYGNAIETAISQSPPLALAAGFGLLQVFATDPPPPKLDAVLIEVREVQVHRAGGDENGWTTVVGAPASFDLLRVAEVQEFLGSQELEAGVYTQIRLVISKATVVAEGQEHDADVPSGRMKITRPFRVEAGKTTAVFLDFEGASSVKVTGAGRYKLLPKIKLLAKEPKDKPGDGDGPGDGGGGTLPPPPPEISAQDTTGERVNIEGPIGSLGGGQLRIRGQTVLLTDQTQVAGTLSHGSFARVEAIRQDDGSFVAVEVVMVDEKGKKPEKPGPADRGGGKPDDTGPKGQSGKR